jgi:tRNA(Leu) C34 or U34 (ribose-2'-O)-methylase TrmL
MSNNLTKKMKRKTAPIKKEQPRTKITKDVLLKHLEQNMGNITLACHFAGCNRSTYYRYYQDDADFRKSVDDIQEAALDICEAEMWKLIKEGNVPTILFYLKTKGKKRGYVERQELTGSNGTPLIWKETKSYDNEAIQETNSSD